MIQLDELEKVCVPLNFILIRFQIMHKFGKDVDLDFIWTSAPIEIQMHSSIVNIAQKDLGVIVKLIFF